MYTRCYTFLLFRKITPQYVVATSVFCKKWRYSVCQYFFLANFVLKKVGNFRQLWAFSSLFLLNCLARDRSFFIIHISIMLLYFIARLLHSISKCNLVAREFHCCFMATFLYFILVWRVFLTVNMRMLSANKDDHN